MLLQLGSSVYISTFRKFIIQTLFDIEASIVHARVLCLETKKAIEIIKLMDKT